MGDEKASNLKALEALLDEFFSPSASNVRKAEIDKLLNSFAEQSTAWKDCLFFLTNTSNHYVCMFSLTTLETVIHQRWVGMFGQDRAEVRTTLNNFLSQHHASAPLFIRNKLIKLIVDIARSDWPHFYPEFFTQILSLLTPSSLASPGSTSLGLTMLLTTSEELATPRQDIATSRAQELSKLMLRQVGHVTTALVTLLELLLDREAGRQAGTPPPSPSVSGDSEDSNSMDGAPGLMASSGPASLIHAASVRVLSDTKAASPCIPMEAGTREVAELCLKCLAHIFTWCSPSLCVSSRLINILFQYAALETKAQGREESCTELSVLAMSAVNEIIYKNYVPQDFNEYFLVMVRNCYHLLQNIVSDQTNINDLDEVYLSKITEFLRLFVSIHLARCEQNPQFPLLEFLALIFKYTFRHKELSGFVSCLEVWTGLVDYVSGSVENRKDAGEEILKKYQEALLTLVVEILKKSQFRLNGSELNQLNNISVGDDGMTEWGQFLFQVLELTMKVTDLLPEQVLGVIDQGWREASRSYLEMDTVVMEIDGVRVINLSREEDVEKVVCVLRDLSSFLQLIGRLSDVFIGEHFRARLKPGLEYVKQLLALVSFGSKNKLWTVNLNIKSNHNLQEHFVRCHAETIAALKTWCHWLAALHSESLQDSSYTWVTADLTSSIVRQVVVVVKDTSSPDLTHSAAHFLVTLTGTVRPASIWKLKDFTDLYSMINHLSLASEAHRLLVRSLTNVLLLPWPGTQEQRWDDRRKHCSKFLRDLTEKFRAVKTQTSFAQDRGQQIAAEPHIVHTLQMIGDLVDNVLNEVTQTKKLCYDVSRDYIETCLWLFPLYVENNKVCEQMFQFFYTVFDVLKTQMGAQFVEQSVHTFFSMFGSSQLSEVLLQKKGILETRVVERFLSILTFIVSEPGSTFRKFVSMTLSLCLETIFPLIADQPASDIKTSFYNLLFHTLLHNWNFFFKSNLKAFHNNNGQNCDDMEHREAFLGVMKAFGQSFMQTDITVFSQNVASLEQLNQKWRLYAKPVFKKNLLADFLSVFLRALIAKTHNLLKEEIGTAVYNMSSTDFPVFFGTFIPQFLTGVEQLDDNQRQILADSFQPVTDLPSFQGGLDRFINDLRYYQLVNASLPHGSVKF